MSAEHHCTCQHGNGSQNGFFAGILVGIILALLFTTKRGREILRQIIDEGLTRLEDIQDVVKEEAEKIIQQERQVKEVVEEIEDDSEEPLDLAAVEASEEYDYEPPVVRHVPRPPAEEPEIPVRDETAEEQVSEPVESPKKSADIPKHRLRLVVNDDLVEEEPKKHAGPSPATVEKPRGSLSKITSSSRRFFRRK